MLTISKPLSAGQAQTYHQMEFTAKEQNYWSQQGVIAGEWQGQLAVQFGLAGAVSAEDFARLSQGQHPQNGDKLVRQRASYEYQNGEGKTIKTMEHRAGWDATFFLRPPSVPSPSHLVSSRCRSIEGRNKPETAEGGKYEFRRSQHTNQRGCGFPRCSIGVRSQ